MSHENSAGEGRSAPGRVPSFYTSRSIVNLSGLSVADPLPGEEEVTAEETLQAIKATRKSGSSGELVRESGLGAITTSSYIYTGTAQQGSTCVAVDV